MFQLNRSGLGEGRGEGDRDVRTALIRLSEHPCWSSRRGCLIASPNENRNAREQHQTNERSAGRARPAAAPSFNCATVSRIWQPRSVRGLLRAGGVARSVHWRGYVEAVNWPGGRRL